MGLSMCYGIASQETNQNQNKKISQKLNFERF